MPVLHPSSRPPPSPDVSATPAAGVASAAPNTTAAASITPRLVGSRVVGTDATQNKAAMRPAGVPRHSADPNSLKSLVFGTHLQGAALLPSAGTPPPATAPPSRRHLRTASELVGTLGGSAEDSADASAAYSAAAAASPRSRPAGGRPTAHNPWLLSPRAGTRPPQRDGSPRRPVANPNLDATAKEAVFGAPYVPSPTPRRAAEVPAAGKGARWNRDNDPHSIELFRHRGKGVMRGSNEPAVAVVGGGARPHSPLPHAAAVEATLAAGGHTRPPSFLDDALPRKPETRRVAPDASGMPSDRRAVGGELGKQHVTPADPTTPAGVPAPYTPYATIDAAAAAAPTHPQMLSGERHTFDVAGDAGHRGRQLANADAKHAIEAALAPASVARVVFGDGGGAADQGVRQHPVWEGAAGVAQVSAKLQQHPSRPVESGRLQIQAAAAEARVPSTPGGPVNGVVAAAPRLPGEYASRDAGPAERARFRGVAAVDTPLAGATVPSVLYDGEHPEAPRQRWDEKMFETRQKMELVRQKANVNSHAAVARSARKAARAAAGRPASASVQVGRPTPFRFNTH